MPRLEEGRRRPWRRLMTAAAVAVFAGALAACSTPKANPNPNLETPAQVAKALKAQTAKEAKTQATNPETTSGLGQLNPKLPASTDATQTTILDRWVAGAQQDYTYIDEAPAPLRANLVAGEGGARVFPKTADYYVNPALGSEWIYLTGLKMAMINGPTSYNLGTPEVTSLTATTAVVSSCESDPGTTTQSGQAAPLKLGGNDPAVGGVLTTTDLVLQAGAWMIAQEQMTPVKKTC